MSQNQSYLQSLAQGTLPATVEVLSREDKINDYLPDKAPHILGRRFEKIEDRAGLRCAFPPRAITWISLRAQRLASVENDILILSRTGKLLADKISSGFICGCMTEVEKFWKFHAPFRP